MRKYITLILLSLVCLQLYAQGKRPLTTYFISTKVSNDCASLVSLTLFEEGSGNDALNNILIEEFLGTYVQSKKVRGLKNFYLNKSFDTDSSFDFTIYTASTFVSNDIFSFTSCTKYACDKENVSTYETQMATLDATTGKILSLGDLFDEKKMDSLEQFVFKVVNMYHIRSLPTCALVSFNPNQVNTSTGASTTTDVITYIKGLTGKFYLSEGKIHLYNKVKHRDYDYDDVEIGLPMNKLKYFMNPVMVKRLDIQ